jgi:hypothetical protein
MQNGGAKRWYFPDGYLPEKSTEGTLDSHEALMLLNMNESEAHIKIDIYYADRDPVKDIEINVDPERIKTIRLDKPGELGGHEIPVLTQYSLRVRSDIPVVAQFGRLDATQSNLAYYGTMGFCE